ncbi:hypothetical protein SAY87_028394 [Trapa incisa]|uniref:Uncharacterized protein n=1 Tax=Trapa incisa TaxID=236973 RepID=A0AAN7QS01_9MYRT|nr:hypothetical protein SAY87_028394 [Trapa incisa]
MAKHRSGHQERRGLGWLKAVSALTALYTKIRDSGSPSKLKKKKSNSNLRSSSGITGMNTQRNKEKGIKKYVTHVAKEDDEENEEAAAVAFGDGGVWQRSILMGGKCDPLNFSGVIYYDEKGKKLDELPLRSPRASPFPSYLSRSRA